MLAKSLRIVFMGTPDFAVPSLDTLVKNGYNIVGVITAPDKEAGRGQKIQQSPVKQYAVGKGLNVLQPEKLKNTEFIEELKSLKADLQIVVAFRMLPEIVWQMPPKGTFNLHGSLLPQYRGAAPIHWAVMNGEKETGVTTFFLQHEIDTGKIILQEKINIGENDTTGIVYEKLMKIGAGLVLKTVRQIENKSYKEISQEETAIESPLKHAPKIFKEDCKVDWNKSALEIHNFVRGLNPYPTAYTTLLDTSNNTFVEFKIHKTIINDMLLINHQIKNSSISTDNKSYLCVNCSDKPILIEELQLSGKKKMGIKEFLSGFKFTNAHFFHI